MTTLLASSSATSSTATEGDVKTYLANLRTFMADLLGSDSANKALALSTLGSILNGSIAKTSSYTVVEADRGKVISYSGAGGVTVTLASASTLGDGFVFAIANNSSGNITLDPNMSEQINGLTTHSVQPTETVILFCDGSKWLLFGKAPASIVSKFNTRTGDITLTSSDVTNSLGFTPARNDLNVLTNAFVGFSLIQGSWSSTLNAYSKVLRMTRANGATVDIDIGITN